MAPSRKPTALTHTIMYLLPGMMDVVTSMVIFVNGIRISRMVDAMQRAGTPLPGGSAAGGAAVVAIFSAAYTLTAFVLGRFAGPRNAVKFMLTSCAITAVTSLAFSQVSQLGTLYALIALTSVGVALFYMPFMVFMKEVSRGISRPLTQSIGLYTFSWSTGFAVAPFIGGYLMELGVRDALTGETPGWRYTYWVAAAVAVATGIGILAIRHLADPSKGGTEPDAPHPDDRIYAKMPDMARYGWLAAGVACIVVNFVRGVFPTHATNQLHMSESNQGLVAFSLCAAQALTGLLLGRSRQWMYRWWCVAAFGAIGVVGSALFAFTSSPAVFMVAGMMIGCYIGAFFVYMCFHSLVHPRHSSLYTAINEGVVGSAGLVPLAATWLEARGGSTTPFMACATLAALTTVFLTVVHIRRRHALTGA